LSPATLFANDQGFRWKMSVLRLRLTILTLARDGPAGLRA